LRVLSRKELGIKGEDLAASYLARQGYRVIARNHRTPLGELDLIAADGPETVFVEVKTRVGGRESTPEEAVNGRKVERLARLAEAYLIASGRQDAMWRIDVVAVVVDGVGQLRRLDHLRNAVY
jgi:putative endonuclease